MKIHYLKTWRTWFIATWDGNKTFEVRINDRGYELNDVLVLEEYDPGEKVYTGRVLLRQVDYMMQGVFGLPPDVCVMSIKPYEARIQDLCVMV